MWLDQVLAAARGIFTVSCGIFLGEQGLSSCGSRALQHPGLAAPQHVGSWFPDHGSNRSPLRCKADSFFFFNVGFFHF